MKLELGVLNRFCAWAFSQGGSARGSDLPGSEIFSRLCRTASWQISGVVSVQIWKVYDDKKSTVLALRGTTGEVGVTRAEPRREARLIARATVEEYIVHFAAGDALTSAREHLRPAPPRMPIG
jgi:hypothetical protein